MYAIHCESIDEKSIILRRYADFETAKAHFLKLTACKIYRLIILTVNTWPPSKILASFTAEREKPNWYENLSPYGDKVFTLYDIENRDNSDEALTSAGNWMFENDIIGEEPENFTNDELCKIAEEQDLLFTRDGRGYFRDECTL